MIFTRPASVLYEILFGLFLTRLLVGVGLDGGVSTGTSRHKYMEGLFVVRFQMLLFFSIYVVMIFACFSFFSPF